MLGRERLEGESPGSLVDAMSSRQVFKNGFTMALGKILAQQNTRFYSEEAWVFRTTLHVWRRGNTSG